MELHWPDQPTGEAVALTHGAGGNCRAPMLVAVAEAFRAAGVLAARFDLPFRVKRPSGPPMPAGAAADREGIRRALEELRGLARGPIYLGGHSYGGRQASMLAAEEPECATALLLLSYPLHPPGKPEQLRTGHFPQLRTPAVFVHGSRDEFATTEEMTAALSSISAPTECVEIAGAGHDLKRGKFDLPSLVVALRRLTA